MAKAITRRSPLRSARLVAIWLIFMFALVEGGSYVAGSVLRGKWGMYQDPQREANKKGFDYETYLEIRDEVLGWPYAHEMGGPDYDVSGARPGPANDELRQAPWLISLYGDSYTASRHLPKEEGWGSQLAGLIGAGVKNFGVGGYGTDQAYLLFKEKEADEARIVILAHLSSDILRNLTRYRDFQVFSQQFAFKPRFVLDDDGQLQLVPLLRLSPDEYERFLARRSPQLIVEHEHFHPNGPSGAVRLEFPFIRSILRNFRYYRLRAELAGRPTYMEFYEADHDFRGLQITTEICRSFASEAERRGKQRPDRLVARPRRSQVLSTPWYVGVPEPDRCATATSGRAA